MKKMLKIKPVLITVFLFFCLAAHSVVISLKSFTFNEDTSLDKWAKMVLNGEVQYSLVKYGDGGYVRALSENACSALYYRVGYKLKDYPLLAWKWRVSRFPDISLVTTDKEKDDYAARVYVIFPFLSFSSSKFLEYVWADNIPVETIINSPFGDNVKMVVVRSGGIPDKDWVGENRNVYEDYVKAFGEEPRMSVGAIAIMCDADGSGTSAESFFDDIVIEKQ